MQGQEKVRHVAVKAQSQDLNKQNKLCCILSDIEQKKGSCIQDVSSVLSKKLSITDLECSLCCGYVCH